MRFNILSVLFVIIAIIYSPYVSARELQRADGAQSAVAIRSFFDTEIPRLMAENHIVGCTVGVANRDGLLFQKGYGYADLASKRGIDPQKTLFRAGSISKLFVWTAILQLRDEGKLHLDDPVDRYLDFPIPKTYPEPIRIVDLMNHTPGFEDRMIGLFVQDPKLLKPLHDVVRDIPKRIRPPGREISYSNYGTMLAGYIVEKVSGMSFETYVKERILKPLAMVHTTFHQPLHGGWREDLAVGYEFKDGNYIPERFELVQGAPAGAISTTTFDMLRFMRAYLRGGALDGQRILKESTVAEMRNPTFRQDPRGNGMAHGFMELSRGEHPILGHGGDTIYFHSLSGYFPNDDLAFFISTNTATGSMFVYQLTEKFLQRFFPVPTGAEMEQSRIAGSDAAKIKEYDEYSGFYIVNRRSESDPTKMVSLFLYAYIKPTDGGILVSDMFQRKLTRYVEVAKDVFQKANGRDRLLFLRDDHGRINGVMLNEMPVMLFKRPPLYENPVLNIVVFFAGILFLLTALVLPPTGLIHLFRRVRSAGKMERYAIGSSWTLILLQFVLFVMLATSSKESMIFQPFGPANVWPLYMAVLFLPFTVAFAIYSWIRPYWRSLPRIHFTLFAISQLGLFAFYIYWNVLYI